MEQLTSIPRSTLHEIESGQVMPRLDQLENIAKGLNLKITDLFDSDFK